MMEVLTHALLHAFEDTIKLIPFLFVTYMVMEWLERKTQDKQTAMLSKVGRLGPLFGALSGILPQCGFSAAAASLYAGGVISIGTLVAVFFSTSDEMLPLLISNHVPADKIAWILGIKVLTALVSGFMLDGILRYTKYRHKTEKRIHDLCEAEHCGCEEEEGSILHSALVHTIHIVLFVFAITFALTLAVEWIGEETLMTLLSSHPAVSIFLSALVGLVPNCASSIMITQLYLDGMLGFGAMMAGLLVGAGVGLIVLYRTNAHLKENLKITGILYAGGVFWGVVFTMAGIVI